METIPRTLLDARIHGLGLSAETLGAELGDEATLFVFLRHLG